MPPCDVLESIISDFAIIPKICVVACSDTPDPINLAQFRYLRWTCRIGIVRSVLKVSNVSKGRGFTALIFSFRMHGGCLMMLVPYWSSSCDRISNRLLNIWLIFHRSSFWTFESWRRTLLCFHMFSYFSNHFLFVQKTQMNTFSGLG